MTPAPSRFTIDTKGGCALAAYVALCKSAPHAQRMYGGGFLMRKTKGGQSYRRFFPPEKDKRRGRKGRAFLFFYCFTNTAESRREFSPRRYGISNAV